MITKGIITEIVDEKDKHYFSVRVPIFETSASTEFSIFKEVPLCYEPGNLSGYHLDDVVWVGFENNEANNPVILGKLWLGKEEDPANFSNVNSLNVTGNASLPENTTIGKLKYIDIVNKQNRLVAGTNISIDEKNIISSSSPSDKIALYEGSANRNINPITTATLNKYRYLIVEGYIGETFASGSAYSPYFTCLVSVMQLLSTVGYVNYSVGGDQSDNYGLIMNYVIGFVSSTSTIYLGWTVKHWLNETGAGTNLDAGGITKIFGVV